MGRGGRYCGNAASPLAVMGTHQKKKTLGSSEAAAGRQKGGEEERWRDGEMERRGRHTVDCGVITFPLLSSNLGLNTISVTGLICTDLSCGSLNRLKSFMQRPLAQSSKDSTGVWSKPCSPNLKDHASILVP